MQSRDISSRIDHVRKLPPLDPAKQPWPKQAIEAASHGAIAFCQIYYEAFDEPSRRAKVGFTLSIRARKGWRS
jgi:hypothetical protein